MPVTEVPTRFRSVPIVPGGGVTFGDFSVQFIIDEDLAITGQYRTGLEEMVTMVQIAQSSHQNQSTVTVGY